MALIDEKTGKYNKKLTASYLFITKEGTCGRLQLKGPLYQEFRAGSYCMSDGGLRYDFIYIGKAKKTLTESPNAPDQQRPSKSADSDNKSAKNDNPPQPDTQPRSLKSGDQKKLAAQKKEQPDAVREKAVKPAEKRERGPFIKMDANQKRLVRKLPDWLQPLYNHGLTAKIDEDDQVIEISVGSIVNEDLLAKINTLPRLKKLDIQVARTITEKELQQIGHMSMLQSLTFYSVTFPKDGLDHLQKLTDLRELALREAKLTDAHLEHLKGLSKLRVLRLGGNRLTDKGLEYLTGMTNLEVLEIPNSNWVESRMRITDAGFALVARLTKLRELDISRLTITDKGFAQLSGLHELRRLRLDKTQITGNGLKKLASFPQLESLSLGGPWFDDTGMDYVTACHNLKQLFLRYTKIGDKGFRHIGKLEKLERLPLDSHFVTDAGLAHLTSLKHLKHIELRASSVTDETLKHISKISSLTRLDLSGSGYTGVSIGRNFAGTGYTHLAAMPNLKTLWLYNADVRWTELRGLKQLDSMVLMMPTMSADDVRRLQQALPDTRISATWGDKSVQFTSALNENAKPPKGSKKKIMSPSLTRNPE